MSERTGQSYPGKLIGLEEMPFWTSGQFLRIPEKMPKSGLFLKGKVIEGSRVNPVFWVDQHSKVNFWEFDDPEVYKETGYRSEALRADACGITSLHMVLGTLSDRYQRLNPTVGKLAKYALSLHRNDLVENGKVVKKGTPVFNSKAGWYHDGLLFTAGRFGVEGYRFEDVNLEQVALEMEKLNKAGKTPLSIISVDVNYRNGKLESGSHMVIASAFKLSRSGLVESMKITDPSSSASNGESLEKWIKVDDKIRHSFKQRAMFFYV